MLLISGIKLPVGRDKSEAITRALHALAVRPEQVQAAHLAKVSLDARRQNAMQLVCSVKVQLHTPAQEQAAAARCPAARFYTEEDPVFAPAGLPLGDPPVVVGLGPAGLFCALALARQGYRPIVLERGGPVEDRCRTVEQFWRTGRLDANTNVQFGEGGAGTFSDGKLTTRISDSRCHYVLRQLVRFGAPEQILHRAKPHIGTDLLRDVVAAIRREIVALGGQVHFYCQLEKLCTDSAGRICGAVAGGQKFSCQQLVLAVGHSARDTFFTIFEQGVKAAPKAFSVGLRVEHLQADIDRGLYGPLAAGGHRHRDLPVGEYQLSWRQGDRGVYTFCMCPGGLVVPAASQTEMVVVNGMSEFARDRQNANSAVVVSVDSRDFGPGVDGGIRFQQQLERRAYQLGGGNYRAPIQTVGRFLQGEPGAQLGRVAPSYCLGTTPADFGQLFSPDILQMLRQGLTRFGRRLPGFDAPDAVLTGVESRTSSPVRLLRGEDCQSLSCPGLYPCGEGAGYAGGIMSAAVDGIRVAQQIMQQGRPPRR
ncbi:squalene-associated FAD-dependent desaturase [Anaerotruncus sp. 2789STDY5834896]|uniref:Squalene-associated FAD-dependent desaturase n=1 Tax=uncultured Anaerotruncus sp. TaxID=905011 RepID=A0A1C6I2D8_9FIRM|nr:squalene-associated FAD-dependent desaturase [uncultured Anaerotruncus sp.]